MQIFTAYLLNFLFSASTNVILLQACLDILSNMAKNDHTVLIHYILYVMKLSLRFQREKVAKTQLKKTAHEGHSTKIQKN